MTPKDESTNRSRKPVQIPPEEWHLPAGYKDSGELATLNEVVSPNIQTKNLSELSIESKSEIKNLVVNRIEQKQEYKLYVVGEGEVDKNRAIQEIEEDTPLGKYLTRYEQVYLNNVYESALEQRQQENGGGTPH